MNKFLGVCFTTVLGTFLVGCGLLNGLGADIEAPRINVTMPSDSLSTGSDIPITGTIEADTIITNYSYRILNSSYTEVASSKIMVSGPNLIGKEKYTIKNQEMRIIIPAAPQSGKYFLEISVTAGLEETKTFLFYVKGSTVVVEDTLRTKQVTLGAAQNSNPSSLDVDEMTGYTGAQVNNTPSIQAQIDVWFGVNSSSLPKLYSPLAASAESPTGAAWAPANWTYKNATEFVKLGAVSFEAIKTQSAINALWVESSKVSSVQVAANDVVVVKTVEGNYRLLKIISTTTTTAGSSEIVGKIK